MPSSKKCSNLVGVSAGSGLARGALNNPWFALKIPHAALNLGRAPLNNPALALNTAGALENCLATDEDPARRAAPRPCPAEHSRTGPEHPGAVDDCCRYAETPA